MQAASYRGNLHNVQIIETEASIRCGLKPSTGYELAVELSQIVLQQDNKVLFVWPFRHVRRYGYTSNSFSIEAGSKCATGEGLFIFRCQHAIHLYNQAIASVAAIKQLKSRQLAQQRSYRAPGDCGLRYSHELALFGQEHSRQQASGSRDSATSDSVPHYVRNNCEYAQVMKRSSNPVTD